MLQVRTGLLVGLMLVTMAFQAMAADLDKRKRSADSTYGQYYNWSGLYYGGTIGSGDGGVAASAHVGYNWMMPSRIVFGVEGELGFMDTDRGSADLFGTLRGRAGYAFGRFLPYVTAGLAFVDRDRTSSSGSVVGFGAEYAFQPGISGRIEYLSMETGTGRGDDVGLLRAGLSLRY